MEVLLAFINSFITNFPDFQTSKIISQAFMSDKWNQTDSSLNRFGGQVVIIGVFYTSNFLHCSEMGSNWFGKFKNPLTLTKVTCILHYFLFSWNRKCICLFNQLYFWLTGGGWTWWVGFFSFWVTEEKQKDKGREIELERERARGSDVHKKSSMKLSRHSEYLSFLS